MYTEDLTFNARHPTMFFEPKYLQLGIVQNRRSLKEFLKTAPEEILVKYKNATSLTARVRRRLRQSIGSKVMELDEMASAVGVAPATFRCRLHHEGTSFRLIKDQLRQDLAIRHVTDLQRIRRKSAGISAIQNGAPLNVHSKNGPASRRESSDAGACKSHLIGVSKNDAYRSPTHHVLPTPGHEPCQLTRPNCIVERGDKVGCCEVK